MYFTPWKQTVLHIIMFLIHLCVGNVRGLLLFNASISGISDFQEKKFVFSIINYTESCTCSPYVPWDGLQYAFTYFQFIHFEKAFQTNGIVFFLYFYSKNLKVHSMLSYFILLYFNSNF